MKNNLKKLAINFLKNGDSNRRVMSEQLPNLFDYDELTRRWVNNCMYKETKEIEKRMVKLITERNEVFLKKAFKRQNCPNFLISKLTKVAQKISKEGVCTK